MPLKARSGHRREGCCKEDSNTSISGGRTQSALFGIEKCGGSPSLPVRLRLAYDRRRPHIVHPGNTMSYPTFWPPTQPMTSENACGGSCNRACSQVHKFTSFRPAKECPSGGTKFQIRGIRLAKLLFKLFRRQVVAMGFSHHQIWTRHFQQLLAGFETKNVPFECFGKRKQPNQMSPSIQSWSLNAKLSDVWRHTVRNSKKSTTWTGMRMANWANGC